MLRAKRDVVPPGQALKVEDGSWLAADRDLALHLFDRVCIADHVRPAGREPVEQ